MHSFTTVFALLCAATVIVARDPLDCVDTAKRFGAINFISALSEANLTDAVRQLKTSTIFVPTNNAFINLDSKYRNAYLNDSKLYQQTLLNHLINGSQVMYTSLKDEKEYPTYAAGATIRANDYNKSTDSFKTINGARISAQSRDILCGTDVVLHFVEQLITSISTIDLLTTIQRDSSLSKFLSVYNASTDAGKALLKQKEGETVFVPNDAAFNKWPSSTLDTILKNSSLADQVIGQHVIDSETFFSQGLLLDGRSLTNHNNTQLVIAYDKNLNKYTINGAYFVDVDIAPTNGVYHVVDTVLTKFSALDLE